MNAGRSTANLTAHGAAAPSGLPSANLVPRWDRVRRELLVDAQIVKRFRVPAPNQEAVLNAFQEFGWPPRVEDPLHPHPDLPPKKRLNETIKTLNRHHVVKILCFRGDGTGQGVLWEWIAERA